MSSAVTRSLTLTPERAARLSKMAAEQGTSEDALVAKALDYLFSLPGNADDEPGGADWSVASQASLSRVWDNEADARYDDWMSLYGA